MIIPLNRKMLTKERTIAEPFAKEPWRKLTFKEVKRLSSNKSYNYVHTTLKRLVKEGILKEQRIGNNIAYQINDSIQALNTIGFIAEHKAATTRHLPHESIRKLVSKIKTTFLTLLITGSYAKGKQKEASDIDIVIICDDKQNPGSILSQIKLESELMSPEAHPYVFTQSQFYEMLTDKEENYGKESARNNLIIMGGSAYYSILLEATKHGFNG